MRVAWDRLRVIAGIGKFRFSPESGMPSGDNWKFSSFVVWLFGKQSVCVLI